MLQLTFLAQRLLVLVQLGLEGRSWLEADEQKRPARSAPPPPLRRGDLLQVPRALFTHFGIYLGDNKVAHLMPDILPLLTDDSRLIGSVITNSRLILGCVYRCATVRVDTLEDFAYGAAVQVNCADGVMEAQPFPSDRVAQRAEQLLGSFPYSLLWNNCEHFGTYCRYGSASSHQSEKFFGCLKSVVRDQRSVILAGLLGIFSVFCFGSAPSTTLPAILIPFTLWMAG